MRVVLKDGEHVSEDWEIGNPTEVRFMKSKKRDLTECEMHLTLNDKMTVGKNPCKRMKTHHNNSGSKKTLAVAIEDGTCHCVLSNETTIDGDDNTKTASIEPGKQNSENNDKKPPAKNTNKKRRSPRKRG